MIEEKSGEAVVEETPVYPVKLRHMYFEAVQWDGYSKTIETFTGWHNGKRIFMSSVKDNGIQARLYDVIRGVWDDVRIGDWIVKGPEGFHRYHPTVFERRFEIES